MAWEFKPGMQVVCVDDEDQMVNGEKDVYRGQIYVISWVGFYSLWYMETPKLCVRLFGVPRLEMGEDVPLLASRFRPLRKRETSIECFRQLLNHVPSKHEEDA